jgi:hypothetical protein
LAATTALIDASTKDEEGVTEKEVGYWRDRQEKEGV